MTFNYICIDFGTCNSVISYYDTSISKILQLNNEQTGDVLIPSSLFFIYDNINNISDINDLEYEKHYCIGSEANELYRTNSNDYQYYFYQFKRFLGITNKSIESFKDFLINLDYSTNDDTIFFYIKTLSDFKLKLSITDIIKLYFKGLHTKIKNNFNFIDNNIEIIITCPAYFHDLQRSQLKKAAENAGFTIFKVYNEPTAAAIYYLNNDFHNNNQNKLENENENIIVYDLGGGTIDTTVLTYYEKDKICEVIDIDGNNCLGGIDIDNILIQDIYSKYKIDKTNKKWFEKIRLYIEEIKIKLSFNNNHTIYLEYVPIKENNINKIIDNLKITYSRQNLNNLINDIIDKMIEPIKNMYTKYNISRIIFIGGPTQTPLLQNKISSFLKNNTIINYNDKLYKTIVSMGGTYLYKLLKEQNNFCLLDIIPMNIGISDHDNNMVVMIEKNSKIPVNIEKTFTTSHDCQRTINIEIYEGIDNNCKNNTYIGSYNIIGIPPLQRGMILIKLLFKINYNGILNISINGFKNSSDDSGKSFDFKILENIKLISSTVAMDLLKKIFNSEKN